MPKEKPKTVTFQPDEGVRMQLDAIEQVLGPGFRSKFINEALEAELPNVIKRRAVALNKPR